MPHHYEKMGRKLGLSLYEYVMIKEEDEKARETKLLTQIRKRKKKQFKWNKKKLDIEKIKSSLTNKVDTEDNNTLVESTSSQQ